MYEALEVEDVLISTDSRSYSLWDTQRFYEQRTILPTRQQQSIQFCLFENMKEKDAAVKMGIAPTNPVAIYATIGITALLTRAIARELPGYVIDLYAPEALHV